MNILEKESAASTTHTETALATLAQLQQDNENGAAHRDFMQARLDSIETYEAQLTSELERCKQEKQAVKTSSREVGEQRRTTRNQLASRALQLLQAESGTIADRPLLWQTITEHQLAHFVSTENKHAYASFLIEIDQALRDTYDSNKSLPILEVYTGKIHALDTSRTLFGVVANHANGIALSSEHQPYIQLEKTVASITPWNTSASSDQLVLPYNSLIEYGLASKPTTLDVYDSNKPRSEKTNVSTLLVGSTSITAYLERLFVLDSTSQEKAWGIARLIAQSEPVLFNETIESPLIKQSISARASTFLSGYFTKENSALLDIAALITYSELVSDPTHQAALYRDLAHVDEPLKAALRHILEASFPSV